jgi:hypothetical protein
VLFWLLAFSTHIFKNKKEKKYFLNITIKKIVKMAEYIIAVVIILIIIFIFFFTKREYAVLTEPNFYSSLVAGERANLKTKRGQTVNDYALETNLLTGVPLAQGYKIM